MKRAWPALPFSSLRFLAGGMVALALAITSLAADLPSSHAQVETRRVVVVLGDSLAAGKDVDPAEAFPAVLEKQLQAAGLDSKVVNAGVSGDTSAGALRRLDWILRRPLDVLLVEIGGNDGLRGQPVADLKDNLEKIIGRTRAKYPRVQVLIAGMRMPPSMGSYAEQFAKVYGDVAREQQVALVPFLLAGVAGRPEMNLADGIHPTPEGHRQVATNVLAVLKPMLEKHSPKVPPPTPAISP